MNRHGDLARALAAAAWLASAEGCASANAPGSAGDAGDAGSGAMDARADSPTGNAGRSTLHVDGHTLVDHGAPVRLLGVDHLGTESACAEDAGIFEGPSDLSLGAGIAGWKANAVRIPLNEDCVLGLGGLSSSYAGTAYNQHVSALVDVLRGQGLYVILSLSFAAPGSEIARGAPPMADAAHATEFWSVVASTFLGRDGVVFDLYGAPFIDASNASTQDPWECWLHGCTITQPVGASASWQSAGMQDMVDAVRSVGATNVLLAAGLDHGNDLSGWLAHAPSDPRANLAAALHVYDSSTCHDATCWSAGIAPVAAVVPVVTTELGEHDCAHGFLDGFLPWADDAGVSYLGSAWNARDCASGPSLIVDYSGAPTPYGAGLKTHLATIRP